MTDRSRLNNDSISIKVGNDIKNDSNVVSNIFNEYFANIATDISKRNETSLETSSFSAVMSHYADHPSISSIKKNNITSETFSFTEISQEDMCKVMRKVQPKKSTGWDNIPPKLIHLAAEELSGPCASMFNRTPRQSKFPASLKMAEVSPIYKSKDNMITENYRPVSILPCISKLF